MCIKCQKTVFLFFIVVVVAVILFDYIMVHSWNLKIINSVSIKSDMPQSCSHWSTAGCGGAEEKEYLLYYLKDKVFLCDWYLLDNQIHLNFQFWLAQGGKKINSFILVIGNNYDWLLKMIAMKQLWMFIKPAKINEIKT